MRELYIGLITMFIGFSTVAQPHSVARKWNEVLLEAIRNDFARPTIHARNLFHVSAAMYDAWAVFEPQASPFFLGKTVGGFEIPYEGFPYRPEDKETLREEVISYAAYNLILHRFKNSPGFVKTKHLLDSLLTAGGYDIHFKDTDYSLGSAAALGVYLAEQIKLFGMQDGSNEQGQYANLYYQPVNDPLNLSTGGANYLKNPDCWQPLQFSGSFIDQNGNVVQTGVVKFLSPEWGNVIPFALNDSLKSVFQRDGNNYVVYHDPGPPALIDTLSGNSITDPYKWGFVLTALWSGHLDNEDGETVDISPANMGNLDINKFPEVFSDYDEFYDLVKGGDIGSGYSVNPKTNQPYSHQVVPRGDYTRVLAEFWADGPNSETPPGHWFTILNYVSDHPKFTRKFEGEGNIVDLLEWDVKAYFTLAGAMHDVAISVWGLKGYYDYVRPISAIRYMATKGQSTDPDLPRYSKAGLPLLEGFIELVKEGDPLAGTSGENLNEIKLYAWRGHDYIKDPKVDEAGAGWILAKNWWPYQRPTFVTPPFAGYVSGHSTFSRAAAEVLTLLTGDEYFPGGMSEFIAGKNKYLVFEKGPGVDVVLQWARYFDASDQCSLSRIWGGIHTPVDDLPGRKIGSSIGKIAYRTARNYFTKHAGDFAANKISAYPNPSTGIIKITGVSPNSVDRIRIIDKLGHSWNASNYVRYIIEDQVVLDLSDFDNGIYTLIAPSRKSFRVLLF